MPGQSMDHNGESITQPNFATYARNLFKARVTHVVTGAQAAPWGAFFFNLEHWTAAVAAVYRAIENDCPSFFVRACHHASTKQWLIIVDLRNGLKAD